MTSGRRVAIPLARRLGLPLGLLAVAGLSLWLRTAYPAFGVWAPHDDLLFVRLADHISKGEWLGPFDQTTLVKGALFPLFVAANQAIGLPLKLAEHLLYLLSSLLAAMAVRRVTGRRWLVLPLFAVLALAPVFWTIDMARIVREPLYLSLGMILFFLSADYFLPGSRGTTTVGVLLGLVAGTYWLTREEGVWLLPALATLALPWLAETIGRLRGEKSSAARIAVLSAAGRRLAVPLLGFAATVLAVNFINWMNYGVFRNNDFRAGPFPAAYGALARIKHDHWQRYVVFPADARQRAYAVSPAARQLAPYLDGEAGQAWTRVSRRYPAPWGCKDAPGRCNQEILSGWLLWAIRDATAAAGHYRCASCADAFYEQLAAEINRACDTGAIPCHGRHDSLAPLWRSHYLMDTFAASAKLARTLATQGADRLGVPAGILTQEQVLYFRSVVGGKFAEPGHVPSTNLQHNISRQVARLYALGSPYLIAAALIAYLALVAAWLLRSPPPGVSCGTLTLLSALVVAALSRVGLLAYLEATSIPSDNILYLSPALPFCLVFVAATLGLGGEGLSRMLRGRRAFL